MEVTRKQTPLDVVRNLAFAVAVAILFAGVIATDASTCVADECTGSIDTTTGQQSRSFEFEYGVTVNELNAGDSVKLWLPVPPSDQHQTVKILSQKLPGEGSETTEPKFGNKMVYRSLTVSDQKPVSATMRYRIDRAEVTAERVESKRESLSESDQQLFLSANRMVPIEKLPIKWVVSEDKFSVARQIYDRVDEHVRYDKSEPGYGKGDVLWVCDSRFGNCTDFHSLFIAMARASAIPARFEIGFPIPSDKMSGTIGGYHCWASFYDDRRGWFPVDISEADKHPELKEYYFGHLTADRVRFTQGRDLDLVPQQDSPALNYFVYPHVEINGKVAKKSQLQLQFSFQNVALSAESNE